MIPEHKIREEIEWLRVRADAAEESRVSISRTAPLNSKIWQGERDGYTNAADRLEALLESEGGEGRGEEEELERAFANGEAIEPSYHLQVVESLAERAEDAEARAIEAEEALGRVKEWASEATPGVHPEAWLKGVGDAKWVVLSLLPSNDDLPVSKDREERCETCVECLGPRNSPGSVQRSGVHGLFTTLCQNQEFHSCPTCGSCNPQFAFRKRGDFSEPLEQTRANHCPDPFHRPTDGGEEW